MVILLTHKRHERKMIGTNCSQLRKTLGETN